MDKLKMHSKDLSQDNLAKIQLAFPNCITERQNAQGQIELAVDFDLLRQELSANIVEGPQERYRLDWPGKREAMLTANAPIAKTLRPARDESVNFDSTENLFIEGDNLDALKLLQETYLGKVKMIYIDPPYNTGNDFVYNDDFAETTEEFLQRSNQKDEQGNRLVSNSDTNGRFHSDWLSMMLPRLKLARNILCDDGVIFISIGDAEVSNLRLICDQVFGSGNYEGHIHWRRRSNQPNDPTKMIGIVAEHILAYAKNREALKVKGVGKVELTGSFSNPDKDPRGDWASKPWKVGSDQNGSKYIITTPSGVQLDGEWMGDENNYKKLVEDNRIIFPSNGSGSPRKKYFKYEREEEGQCATNWWGHEQFGHNQEGNTILTGLMDGIKNTFSNPKPPRLINNLMSIANCKPGDIVLDFFLGSGSTFEAAFNYVHKLKVIGVQINEPLLDSKREHQPALEFLQKNKLLKTVAEISKERIRRAGQQILEGECHADWNKDIGFRVLKVDTSNMQDVYYQPQQLNQNDLFASVDNIKADRTSEDLLFQVLLDWGVDLTLPIRRETLQGKDVFIVDDNALVACFEQGISEELIHELAALNPLRAVFRDNGFASDAVKVNVTQIFKQRSPITEVKAI